LELSTHKHLSALIQKQRWFILVGFLLSIIFYGFYLIYFFKPLYTSSAKVLVRNVPQSPIVTPFAEEAMVKSESGYSNPLFNYIQILQSDNVARKTYTSLRLYYAKDFEKLAITTQADWVTLYPRLILARVEPSTDVIKVHFNWNNRQHAAGVLRAVLRAFQETNMDIRLESQKKRSHYMDEQLAKLSLQLDTIRYQIRQYRLANNTIDLSSEATELTRARVDLLKQHQLLKAQTTYDEMRKQNLAKQLGVQSGEMALESTAVGGDPYLVKLNQNLALAEQRHARLGAKMTSEHPDMQEVSNEINSLRHHIQMRKQEVLKHTKRQKGSYDPASIAIAMDLVRAQADHLAHESELQVIQQGIRLLSSQENTIPAKQQGLEELTKKERSLAIAFDSMMQKQIEARIKESQVDDNLFVLNTPTQGKLLLNEALSKGLLILLAGLVGGFLGGWLKTYITDCWQRVKNMEHQTGQSILGRVPWIPLQLYEPDRLIASPQSESGKAYTRIANQLVLRAYREEVQTIALVASTNNRQDSRVAYNLCTTLCRLNKSVVFISLLINNPVPRNTLTGLAKKPELEEKALDLADVVTQFNMSLRKNRPLADEDIEKLFDWSLMPLNFDVAGNTEPNGSSLVCLPTYQSSIQLQDIVGSRGFETLLTELKQRYEFVVIDTPDTAIQEPAIQLLLDVVDASVIVTSRTTGRKGTLTVMKQFQQNNQAVLGVIARSGEL
jgi:polysaccharide biosynthesis transport protein